MYSKSLQYTSLKPTVQKKRTIGELLREYSFAEADIAFSREYPTYHTNYEKACEKYERLKSKFIGEFLEKLTHGRQKFDSDQLNAIASIRKNTLVTARAGSGKTQVIAGKIAFELETALKSKNILALSFNSKAADEMLERIQSKGKGFGKQEFGNAFTFHSLAYRLLKPSEEILIDVLKYDDPKSGEEISVNTLGHQMFIRDIFANSFNGEMRKAMERSFSRDLKEFERFGVFSEDEDYIAKRREQQYYSYTNVHTRSQGEKYLLDFLYEFGFKNIRYEPPQKIIEGASFTLKKADASCKHPNIKSTLVFEHWGVDENSGKTPEHWGMSKEEYLENRERKKTYYTEQERRGKCIFIETSFRDMEGNYDAKTNLYKKVRKRIEEKLKRVNPGFASLKKLSKEEFIDGLRKKDRKIPGFIGKVQQYINHCQLQEKNLEDILGVMQSGTLTQKEKDFHFICSTIYEKYEEKKKKDGLIDFNTLLKLAAEKIENEPNIEKLQIVNNSETPGSFTLSDLKLICIDEYQDFSTRFFRLIQAIEKKNPNFGLFVVGDDWQAINQFAGSDIRYFMEFKNRYHQVPTTQKHLTKNYRSIAPIVELGNKLMKNQGMLAESVRTENQDLQPEIILDNEVSDDFKKFESLIEASLPPSNNISEMELKKRKIALWTIICAIGEMEKLNDPQAQTFAITRNNITYGMKQDEWLRSIKRFQAELLKSGLVDTGKKHEFLRFLEHERFVIMTAHKSKGKQAESVVLLDVSEKNYPSDEGSLKKDSHLYEYFDDTSENQLDNARHLLYVGITRSKRYLKILMDSENPCKMLTEIVEEG